MPIDRFIHALIQWQAVDRPAPARTLTPAEVRRRYTDSAVHSRGTAPEPVAEVTDRTIDGQGGTFRVRVYLPVTDRGRLVTYLHGGGWMAGDVDTHDPVCRRVASALDAVVVSVDYRRAPEHSFPVPLQDGIAAADWAAAAFPGRDHVIAGDSAGAGLALGISMHRRDRGDTGFAAQLLVYPPADPTMASESVRAYGTGYLAEADDLRWYYEQYVPDPAHRTHPAIDLLNADHRGLPPTVVGTAEFDGLRDEGVDLASRLAAAGVAVRHVPAPGLVHGYLLMAGVVPAASAALRDVLAAVERTLTSVPTAK
ncbi:MULTISPECIES: alpha/beta hydrolase [unclassified Streptomyces]|uniref:alpha/beta hydrolase n=1 Tax=unclassified Streptomyces TaxID=2593676 RepID=UPI00080539D6|nr:alpha/beta hydrolase [Streptomyces sp. OspMP-M45]MYR72837.1 alpha/beta hydrolase fold domain-containing protein [Streptomyces sp. SID4925]SBU95473.1 acetyl esterase [Streptomyces sp. OspMP-M45]